MMNYSIPKNKYNNGFSLIELLVSMTLGLFLLTGIASSYIASKQSSVNRSETSELEDNGRLALDIMTQSLEHTGHAPNLVLTNPFVQNIATDIKKENCETSGNNIPTASLLSPANKFKKTSDGSSSTDPDTIGIIFHGDNEIFTDCTGGELTANCRLKQLPALSAKTEASKIYNSFYVSNNQLMCVGSLSTAPAIIADGIENMKFLYGVDTDGDGAVNQYVNATGVGANWAGVISIQVAILVRTQKNVKSHNENKKFNLLGTEITKNDRRKRAVFSTTIFLHNAI